MAYQSKLVWSRPESHHKHRPSHTRMSCTYNGSVDSCCGNVCESENKLSPEEVRANWEWLAAQCGISGDVGDKRVIEQIITAAKKKHEDMIASLNDEDEEIPDLV